MDSAGNPFRSRWAGPSTSASRQEFLEAVKSLAQARIDQLKEGGKKSKLKRIEDK